MKVYRQKNVLFVEPSDDAFDRPLNMQKLLTNRLTIEEEARFEISSIIKLENTSVKISDPNHSDYTKFEIQRKRKGMGLCGIFTRNAIYGP